MIAALDGVNASAVVLLAALDAAPVRVGAEYRIAGEIALVGYAVSSLERACVTLEEERAGLNAIQLDSIREVGYARMWAYKLDPWAGLWESHDGLRPLVLAFREAVAAVCVAIRDEALTIHRARFAVARAAGMSFGVDIGGAS